MRTIKDGKERRQELLDIARKMFITKGYEKTSVNDILKEVGIAKGTFYYYFASKEEMLEAMIFEVVMEGVERAKVILKEDSIPLLMRILMALQAQPPEMEGADMIHAEIVKPENAKLDQVYLRMMIRELTKVLKAPVEEAVCQGVMETRYPEESIGIVMLLAHEILNRPTFAWNEEEEGKKMQVFLYHVQKILGIPDKEMKQIMRML